ncbi:MAG: hypothetical protein ACOX0H_00775 [Patescibacteria group bacterium]|jgi:aromatic ring-opening dioxygenase LigB subunit|nr:class III extradiol dioxygenase subunit B-like domain-containing protein [bacterium]HQC49883.1 class III extradiol dioxygenase subunit B-like domain-containing protein [bacterium]
MPLKKAYLLPRSPLLIPEIGKANNIFLQKTLLAYEQAKNGFITENIETVIVISLHSHIQENFFLINCAPEMEISFQDFGFIPPKTIIKGDIPLADSLKNYLKNDFPIKSSLEMKLDYGSGIPLYLIKNPEQAFKTVVITPADKLELEEHLALGKKIGELLKDNPRQTALIVSGNLSHRLKRKSPGGYSPRGSKFDNKIIEYLSEPETAIANLLKMDKRLVLDASECALRPLMIALGILENYYYEPDILAYQTDFGVGYLSLEFILKNEARVEAKADAEKEETKLSKQKLNFNPIPLKEL